MSRPDGQAPADAAEAYWFKCDMDAWALVRDLLPRPWPAALCMEDLKHLAARERYRRAAWDGQTALQARWGVSASTVKRYLAAARAKAGPALDQPWTSGEPSEQHQQPIADDARTSPGPALDQPWTSGELTASENAQQVALLEAPKRESETEIENTSKPAKAGGGAEEVCADLLKAMHAIALEHDPKARLQRVTTHETRIARTLKGVAKEAKAAGKAPAELILDGWRWWWANPRAYLREQYPGAAAYPIVLQAEKVLKYASAWAEVEAARYIPTADEALDAVIEVGSKAAGARYPAVAHVISEVFVQNMGARLEKMRENPQQERMRAVWRTAYDSRVTRPALSLVAR